MPLMPSLFIDFTLRLELSHKIFDMYGTATYYCYISGSVRAKG